MIFLFYLFGVTIIGTLLFLTYLLKNLSTDFIEKYLRQYVRSIPVVEKIYNPVTLEHSFKYSDGDMLRKQMMYRLMDPEIFSGNVVTGQKHLEALFEKEVQVLTRKMIRQGLIEIIQFSREDEPYQTYKTVILRVRVYKEEGCIPQIKF